MLVVERKGPRVLLPVLLGRQALSARLSLHRSSVGHPVVVVAPVLPPMVGRVVVPQGLLQVVRVGSQAGLKVAAVVGQQVCTEKVVQVGRVVLLERRRPLPTMARPAVVRAVKPVAQLVGLLLVAIS